MLQKVRSLSRKSQRNNSPSNFDLSHDTEMATKLLSRSRCDNNDLTTSFISPETDVRKSLKEQLDDFIDVNHHQQQ